MEISHQSVAEFKTLVTQVLKKISEDLNSIKKIQLQINETLIEIKNIYREITVEWVKLRIKSMNWNIRKQTSKHAE